MDVNILKFKTKWPESSEMCLVDADANSADPDQTALIAV